jgi:hypothetical protein
VVSLAEGRLKLEDYIVDSRVLDAVVTSEGVKYRFERVRAHSDSDKATFIVMTKTMPTGAPEIAEWLVASTRQGLKVNFSGWQGTRFFWKSKATWGGHKGSIDIVHPEEEIQVHDSWDN